jgi:peptidoglycan hydrolase CwlO-like protein
MTKKLFFAFILIFSAQPYSAQAATAETVAPVAPPALPCEQQRREIQALEIERDRMTNEIYSLQNEIRQLNETLNNIRSQLGNEGVHPN